MSYLYVNSIMRNPSLCDGIGYRTVLFLQGCDLHCKGCQNPSTWDITKGKIIDVKELSRTLRSRCFNKELTITGGEPLMQKEALLDLLKELKDSVCSEIENNNETICWFKKSGVLGGD